MNEVDAKKLARDYLCGKIELGLCAELPGELYGYNPAEELLYSFRLFG